MNKFKKVLNALLFPRPPINFIIAVVSFLFVGSIFLFDVVDTPVAYVAYFTSSYGLYLMIMALIVPAVKSIKTLLRKNKYIDRYFSDSEFKSRVTLYRGTAINIFFALFKLASGIIYKSYWLAAIAFYYIALCVIKFVLVRNDIYLLRKKEISDRTLREWKAYRRAGKFIMLINIGFVGIVIQVVWKGQTYSYPYMIIFVIALYAFYQIITTIVRMIKSRKKHNPIFSAAKMIDFTVAAVAMFTLQTAMLHTFGEGNAYFAALLNSITGIVVAIIVIGVSIRMMSNAKRHITKINNAFGVE